MLVLFFGRTEWITVAGWYIGITVASSWFGVKSFLRKARMQTLELLEPQCMEAALPHRARRLPAQGMMPTVGWMYQYQAG